VQTPDGCLRPEDFDTLSDYIITPQTLCDKVICIRSDDCCIAGQLQSTRSDFFILVFGSFPLPSSPLQKLFIYSMQVFQLASSTTNTLATSFCSTASLS
jgi:hypothetical protein